MIMCTEDEFGAAPPWQDELIALARNITQDDDPPRSPEEEAEELAGHQRLCEIVDSLNGKEGPAAIRSLLLAVHPIEHYEIYEAIYSHLATYPAADFGRVAARVLPEWLETNGIHPNISDALERLTYDDRACREFTIWAGKWRSQQRELVLDAMRLWSHESQYWETVFVALGGEAMEVCLDPVPTGWPEEWRWAVELFRQDGDLQLLRWAMDQKPADYGPLLAVLELDHGPNWRGIRRLIDLFLSSRERMRLVPGFVAALEEQPRERQDRVRRSLERAWPGAIDHLRARYEQFRQLEGLS